MRKLAIVAMCGVMAATMLLGSTAVFAGTTTGGDSIPNPFVECKTIDEAAQVAGFTFSVPEKIGKTFDSKSISAIKDQLIQVDYKNGTKNDQIELRKAAKCSNVSGVYTKYKNKTTAIVNGTKVVMKGNGTKVSVASWNAGKYSYSIYASVSKKGISKALVKSIVKKIDVEKTTSNTVLKTDVQNSVTVGQQFNVVLEDNPSTGYEWTYKIDSDNVKLVKQFVSKDGSGTAENPIVGAPSEVTWTFTAASAGTYTITFTQARSWETGVAPAQTMKYVVVVK